MVEEERATHQDIRPLQICILNLMPKKEDTELQLLRMLSNTPLQLDITFMRVGSHESTHTSSVHLHKFYYTFAELKERRFDGLIITGAPRRVSTIITACPSAGFPTSCSAYIRTRYITAKNRWSAALTTISSFRTVATRRYRLTSFTRVRI